MPINRVEEFNNVETLKVFFRGWLVRQWHYLQELLQSVERIRKEEEGKEDEVKHKELIARVIAHYKQYYEAKSKATRENVFVVLSPTWFSSFGRSSLWISGFKPGLAFQLVINHVTDLSKAQRRRFEDLAAETREEERELEEVVARVQERLADPRVLEAARVAVNGDRNHVELVIERLRSAMEEVVEGADCLRVKTVVKAMELMNAAQTLVFLAAFTCYDHTLWSWDNY